MKNEVRMGMGRKIVLRDDDGSFATEARKSTGISPVIPDAVIDPFLHILPAGEWS